MYIVIKFLLSLCCYNFEEKTIKAPEFKPQFTIGYGPRVKGNSAANQHDDVRW